MGRNWKPPLSEPPAGRAFLLIAFDDLELFFDLRKDAEKKFGRVDYETDNFSGEIRESLYGGATRRLVRILSFQRPVGREELVDFRRRTLGLEQKRQAQGRPLIELDPGYVTEFQVLRSSLAEDFHRIYLYGGLYGDALYYFERLSFRPFAHTPAFFRGKEVVQAFNDIRLIHLND